MKIEQWVKMLYGEEVASKMKFVEAKVEENTSEPNAFLVIGKEHKSFKITLEGD